MNDVNMFVELKPILVRADEEVIKVLHLKFNRVLIIIFKLIILFIFTLITVFPLVYFVHDLFLNDISDKLLRVVFQHLLFWMNNGFIILYINQRLLRH